jgi:hypothetical protein
MLGVLLHAGRRAFFCTIVEREQLISSAVPKTSKSEQIVRICLTAELPHRTFLFALLAYFTDVGVFRV